MSYYGEQEDVGCVASKPEEGVGKLICDYIITPPQKKKTYRFSHIQKKKYLFLAF